MIELKNWIEQNKFGDKPWLLLGKGPTFAKINEVDLQKYNTFALNHVVRETKVDIAHIVDIDVVEPLGSSLLENCNWLIMPRTPHVKCFASEYMALSDWTKCIPILQEADKQGKLITYSFSHEAVDEDPWTVIARYFSSEAALGILARMGVRKIRSLGIDGGKNYSKAFADLKDTLLANSQPNFDLQFEKLEEIAKQFDLDYAPIFPSTSTEMGDDMAINSATVGSTATNSPKPISAPEATIHSAGSPLSASSRKDAAKTQTTAAKIQQLECDYRTMRSDLSDAREQLAATAKELGITSDRLGWARDEIKEYRARITQLENDMHGLYKSYSWKLGRLATKPAEAIARLFTSSSSTRNSSDINGSCTKLTEE